MATIDRCRCAANVILALLLPAALAAQATRPVRPRAGGSATTVRVQIDTGLGVMPGGPSPDGTQLTGVDIATSRLLLVELATRRARTLVGSTDVTPVGTPMESLFSPDGAQVLYSWIDFGQRRTQLRIAPAAGGPSTVLYAGDSTENYVMAADWSADGSTVAALVTRADRSTALVLVPVSGATPQSMRVLRSFADWRVPTTVRLSPDGQHVAYAHPQAASDGRREIHLLSLADGVEQVLAAHPGDDAVLGWTGDGAQLVFSSSRGGSPGVWSLPMRGGRVAGAPRLIRGDLWRMVPQRMTPSGQVFYTVPSGTADLRVAPFDALTGRLTGKAVAATATPGDLHVSPAWSADGKYLTFLVLPPDESRVGTTRLTIRSLESGADRVFYPPVPYLRRVAWFPDGRSLMLDAADMKGERTLLRFDLSTGETTPLVTGRSGAGLPARDGRAVYYVAQFANEAPAPNRARRLVRHDLATHRETDVYVVPEDQRIVMAYGRFEPNLLLTHDGRQLAFVVSPAGAGGATLMTVPTTGGRPRVLLDSLMAKGFTNVRLVGTSPDDRHLLFTTVRPDGPNRFEPPSLWRVPMSGGAPVRLAPPAGFTSGSVSPDGTRLAFTAGTYATEWWRLTDPRLTTRATRTAPAPQR